jgi:hypothetical protein
MTVIVMEKIENPPPHSHRSSILEDHHGQHRRIVDGTRLVRHPSCHRHLADGSHRGLRETRGSLPHHLHLHRCVPVRDGHEQACDGSQGQPLRGGEATPGDTQHLQV